jgi:hypothetical protein
LTDNDAPFFPFFSSLSLCVKSTVSVIRARR